jgi:hypothetical protein
MPHLGKKAQVQVIFSHPTTRDEAWVKADLWKDASAIPGVEVSIDYAGKEAKLFGAETSGQAFLYDGDGNLVFSGGITPARGHMGESAGQIAILAWARNERITTARAPVFGCALRKPASMGDALDDEEDE